MFDMANRLICACAICLFKDPRIRKVAQRSRLTAAALAVPLPRIHVGSPPDRCRGRARCAPCMPVPACQWHAGSAAAPARAARRRRSDAEAVSCDSDSVSWRQLQSRRLGVRRQVCASRNHWHSKKNGAFRRALCLPVGGVLLRPFGKNPVAL